ncbi:hypothetical protein HHI36_020408 [Cryptolaemus montrouzieri]|uniref:Uncharacterized protein n=1 Tax=Cryptolaemus montrouzieri TaxID=559131 RepID=A0ABD2NA63_9CUCU
MMHIVVVLSLVFDIDLYYQYCLSLMCISSTLFTMKILIIFFIMAIVMQSLCAPKPYFYFGLDGPFGSIVSVGVDTHHHHRRVHISADRPYGYFGPYVYVL